MVDYTDEVIEIIEVITERISKEVEGRMVDNGIGSYEYGGATGFDRDWQFELVEEEVEILVEKTEALPVEFIFEKIFEDKKTRNLKVFLHGTREYKDKIYAEYKVELI